MAADSVLFTLDVRNAAWREAEEYLRTTAPAAVAAAAAAGEASPWQLAAALVAAAPLSAVDSFVAVRFAAVACAGERCVPHAVRAQLLEELRGIPLYSELRDALKAVIKDRGLRDLQLAQDVVASRTNGGESSCPELEAYALDRLLLQHQHQQQQHQEEQQQQRPLPGCGPTSAACPNPEAGANGSCAGPTRAQDGEAAHTAAPWAASPLLPEKLCMLLLMLHPAHWPQESAWADPTQARSWLSQLDAAGATVVRPEVAYLLEQFRHIDLVQAEDAAWARPPCGAHGGCELELDCAVRACGAKAVAVSTAAEEGSQRAASAGGCRRCSQ